MRCPAIADGSGLVGDRFATALDDSGQPVGTQIGQSFGLTNMLGFDAPYGSLVGRFADGTFQLLGANSSGPAAGSGELTLLLLGHHHQRQLRRDHLQRRRRGAGAGHLGDAAPRHRA